MNLPAGEPVAPVPERHRVNPLVELHWHDWGEDSVVLEARSGQLFEFDALSAALMAYYESGLQTEAEVLAELKADLGTVDDELVDTVRSLVQEFRRLGWLEPIIV